MVSISSPTDASAGATHLQLLLQQHHALQRQEQEARERRDREQHQLKQNQARGVSTTAGTSSSSTSPSLSDLKADAQSVAAYMAAYLRVASANTDRTRVDNNAACLTIDPAKTSFASAMSAPSTTPPATISPSSTLLHSSPPPLSTESTPMPTSQKACAKPAKSNPHKKPSFSSSDAASNTTTAGAATEAASEAKSNNNSHHQHRQECYNCGVTKTPLWRRTHDRLHSLCNACGLYYKQYKSNRPLVARPKDQGAAESLMAAALEQQSKRRKVEDGNGEGAAVDGSGILVKTEPSDSSQQKQPQEQYASTAGSSTTTTSTFKLLLPHPPTRQQLPQFSISQTATPSSHQLRAGALDAERQDEYAEDQEEDSVRADMESDDHGTDEALHDRVDVDMTDAQLDPQSSDDSDSNSDSDDENENEDRRHVDDKVGTQESDETTSKEDSDKKASNSTPNGGSMIECANCGQTQTPLWRKDAKGQSICNACGLYARLHHRDRPVTMRKTKIARRKRDWSAAQEKMTANKNSHHGINGGGDNVEHGRSGGTKSKNERGTSKARHIEVRAMNIPVNTEHELDDSTICLLDQGAEDHEMPTPASIGSPSPMRSPIPATSSLGNGALSPSLTASPPTPALSPPLFINTASTFPGLNPLLMQQYQQQLQALQQQQQQHYTLSSASESLPSLGNSWLSHLYSQYPSVPMFHNTALPRDPMALAALQLHQQQQQQQQSFHQQPTPFQTEASSPVSPVSVTSGHSFPLTSPSPTSLFIDTQALPDASQQERQQPQQPQQQSQHQPAQQQKKGQGGPLILDSSRFTRLMNQMSKAQLSMFLTILEERCGALRHRLSGEDDEVERVDTNEMMMMLNNPHFTSMESGFSGSGMSSSRASTPASVHMMALNDPLDQDRNGHMM
ncbi:putative electron transfer flavoprotein subunit [Mortierella alpina]|nr:putative electron transfer flavoprotein subunit [Mortierella alpina]